MSGGSRMACLEKCILEIALAAINDIKETTYRRGMSE